MGEKYRVVMARKLIEVFAHMKDADQHIRAILRRNISDIQPEWFADNKKLMDKAQALKTPVWPAGMDCIFEEISLLSPDGEQLKMRLEFIPIAPDYVVIVNTGDRKTYPSSQNDIYMMAYPECLEETKSLEWEEFQSFGIRDGQWRMRHRL